MAKRRRAADESGSQLAPAVFSRVGQAYESIKRLINEQTRHKLTLFDGEAKRSKIKSTIKAVRARLYCDS